jgi:hypothetical protein
MRRLLLCGVAALLVTHGAAAATLNKCIDARGKVTYSNLPCPDARETRAVEIDAAPVTAPAPAAKPSAPSPAKATAAPTANIRLDTQRTTGKPTPHASSRRCEALTDQLGRLFDKMDQARRSGYTQKQMDAWNQEVKALERKKQQAHCF